ncbi:hypothetical protein [Paenibacillus oryzisoli]|uniref:Uncharacterized protein n=1 Tax=Paenibacillus oryzisoli TaxID=1850517 RepID=A0A197ZZ91_9BACL|nr:hypothetical protein [Paenibacillus oryzisoli]OAS14524.1 hypothetical protein A8708_34055 [Paenibacillus oryzisoli]
MQNNPINSQLNEVIMSWEQYLNRSLPLMKELADRFYKSIEQQPWGELPQLTEAFLWIFQVFETLAQAGGSSYEAWKDVEQAMNAISHELQTLNDAISDKDPVAVGDILNYEVLPKLEGLHSVVSMIIKHEVAQNETN